MKLEKAYSLFNEYNELVGKLEIVVQQMEQEMALNEEFDNITLDNKNENLKEDFEKEIKIIRGAVKKLQTKRNVLRKLLIGYEIVTLEKSNSSGNSEIIMDLEREYKS